MRLTAQLLQRDVVRNAFYLASHEFKVGRDGLSAGAVAAATRAGPQVFGRKWGNDARA